MKLWIPISSSGFVLVPATWAAVRIRPLRGGGRRAEHGAHVAAGAPYVTLVAGSNAVTCLAKTRTTLGVACLCRSSVQLSV